MSATSVPGSSSVSAWMLLYEAERSFQPVRRLLTLADQVVAVDPERVLGPRVRVPLGRLQHLRQPLVDRPRRQLGDPVQAGVGEVQRVVRLRQQHLEAGEAVALAPGDDLQGVPQLAVGQVRLVAAQVGVDPRAARDGPAHAVRVHRLGRERPDAAGAPPEDLVAEHQVVEDVHARAHRGDRLTRACGPAGRQVLLEAADAVEHVVHAPAGDLLHDVLEHLALAERVEHRRDPAQLQRVGAEEHQVVQHPVQLGEQGACPHRPLGDLHAEHPLHGEDDAQLV